MAGIQADANTTLFEQWAGGKGEVDMQIPYLRPGEALPAERHPWVARRQPVIKSLGEGKEQCEILRALAGKLGPRRREVL